MALTKDLAIFKSNYTLCKIFLDYSKLVSKIIRFGEYNNCVSKAFLCLDLLRRINSNFESRISYLNEYILLLDDIFNRVSLFVDTKFMDCKKGTNIIYLVDNLLKLATGWLKSAQKSELQRHVQCK